MKKRMIFVGVVFISLFVVRGGLSVFAAEDSTPTSSEIKQQVDSLKEQSKEHRKAVRKQKAEMVKIHKEHKREIHKLKEAHNAAVAAGDSAKANQLEGEIKALKKERHEKIAALHDKIEKEHSKRRETRKALGQKMKEINQKGQPENL